MTTIAETLRYLRPNVDFVDRDGTLASIVWPDGIVPPTTAEVTAAQALLDCWSRRRAAYPPIGDALDALVHQANGDATKWTAYVAACNAVKAANPKPPQT